MHLLGTHSDPQNLQDPQHRQPSLFDNAPLPNTNDNDPRPVHRHPNLPDPSDSRFP